MSRTRLWILTACAMLAFAGNSLLCRLALRDTAVDAASFTSIRLVSGAAALWLLLRLRAGARRASGDWLSALALFAYAAAFSFAYLRLSAGTGALLLFAAVQATMIGYGLWAGERFGVRELAGLACAAGGLVGLLRPGLSAPPPAAAALMLAAGAAWGVYSLRGRRAREPVTSTAGNFLLAVPLALALSGATLPWAAWDGLGVGYAVASGALASGAGYALWYAALRGLSATHAATVQLSVPVIAAAGGVAWLGEHVTLRLALASCAILGGIALVVSARRDRG
jgi:drug/metabolite transporter (DMT)-like permease